MILFEERNGSESRPTDAPAPAHAEVGPAKFVLGHNIADPLKKKVTWGNDKIIILPQPESHSDISCLSSASIIKAFEDLYEAIKKGCDDARKNLLERVIELEKNIESQEEKKEEQRGKAKGIPKNNPSPTLFSVLRSCLGEERKKEINK